MRFPPSRKGVQHLKRTCANSDSELECTLKLLLAFKEATGFGVLLNTSLNKKGFPIVETPEDAISLFCESDMDMLVLEDYLLEKHGRPDVEQSTCNQARPDERTA